MGGTHQQCVRPVTLADAGAVQAIYAHYVHGTAITFDEQPPSVAAMAERIRIVTSSYPWLVYERQGEILGYAYAAEHRSKAAYRWSVDVSIYVRPEGRRQGIGDALYGPLLNEIERLGYANAYAGITLPNAASVGLHERYGFTPVGVFRKVGFKLGAWHDVGWWQRESHHPEAPAEPRRPSGAAR